MCSFVSFSISSSIEGLSANSNDVKLGDFGLAALMEECTRGSVSGTPNYLAPEV